MLDVLEFMHVQPLEVFVEVEFDGRRLRQPEQAKPPAQTTALPGATAAQQRSPPPSTTRIYFLRPVIIHEYA